MSAIDTLSGALAQGRCVVLDGGVATELASGTGNRHPHDEQLWGLDALLDDPARVRTLHERYVLAGCDVITTDTWSLPSLLVGNTVPTAGYRQPTHWPEIARRGVRLAREAIAAADRTGRTAVAFSLNADLDTPGGPEIIKLLTRALEDEAPDLVLFETLSVIRDSLYDVVAALAGSGLPVWMSFRRCRRGLCGVFGQHWGGPEGDAFCRAVRRFEELGISAVLVNCIPPDHVDGMISYLRDFTDLPLGVHPNLGYFTDHGWRFPPGVGGDEYAAMARRWRAEGADIIGGCCGVGPDHIRAMRSTLEGTPRGAEKRGPPAATEDRAPSAAAVPTWTDEHGRDLFPLPVPELTLLPEVFVPTQGSLTVWRYLFTERIGTGQRCLDVGCGAGLQAIQLALNGAKHVQSIDRKPAAVETTLLNAFRNGVADVVSASVADLFSWVPDERYDVVVASLYQTPVDPFSQLVGHRPMDYWGRNLVDHLMTKLPDALAPGGVAYVLQLSILSQQRTAALLGAHDLVGEVVDFGFFPMTEHFDSARAQIDKVQARSDAYHLTIGGSETMVAYLLKITRR